VIEDFKRMKTGIDWHAFCGILGVSTAVVLQNFSTVAAGMAAVATAAYMIMRVAREWRAMKREAEKNDGPLCQNFAPVQKKNTQNENQNENYD
jgi:hypothetical protein